MKGGMLSWQQHAGCTNRCKHTGDSSLMAKPICIIAVATGLAATTMCTKVQLQPNPGITIVMPGVKYANVSTKLINDHSAVCFAFHDAKIQATVSKYIPPPMQTQEHGNSLIMEIVLLCSGFAVSIISTILQSISAEIDQ